MRIRGWLKYDLEGIRGETILRSQLYLRNRSFLANKRANYSSDLSSGRYFLRNSRIILPVRQSGGDSGIYVARQQEEPDDDRVEAVT